VIAAMVRRVPLGLTPVRAFGRITAISGNQITLQGRDGEKTIVVSNSTQYMKDGQTVSAGDLKVGDPVMVAGEQTNGQFIAHLVLTRKFEGRRQPGAPNQP
jgi:hypothetical protein